MKVLIKKLLREALDTNVYVRNIDQSFDNEIHNMINNEFISHGTASIGLFIDDKLIGAVLLEEDNLPLEHRFDIIIDKPYRGKGYSHKLINAMIQNFNNDSKAKQLIGWVVNKNLLNQLISKYNFKSWEFEGEDFVGIIKPK